MATIPKSSLTKRRQLLCESRFKWHESSILARRALAWLRRETKPAELAKSHCAKMREREWHKSDKSRAFIALCGRCRGVSLNNGLETLVKIFFNESGSLGETPTKVTIKFFGPQWRPWKGSRTLCPFGSCRQSRLSIIDKWKQWLLPAPVINGLPFWGCFNYICSPGLPPPPPTNREGFVSVMKMLRSEEVKKAVSIRTCIYNVVNGAEVVSHIEVKMPSWRIIIKPLCV